MDDFASKTVFITGGAKGIGLGMARAFAAVGARLAIVDVDEVALAAAKLELERIADVEAHRLDVRDREAYARIADEVEGRLGPVSVLCNNAGVAGAFALDQMNYDLWDLVLGVNLGGFVNGVQTFLPRMLHRDEPGHLVFTSAGAGLATAGYTGYMYETSKYGVMGLGESLSKQLRNAHRPIGVTILCPGPVPTHATETLQKALGALPPGAAPCAATPEDPAKAEADRAAWRAILDQGMPPDEVGELVLEAIRANRLFLHTDRSMWDAIWARTKALLAAMPTRPAPSVVGLPKAEERSTPSLA